MSSSLPPKFWPVGEDIQPSPLPNVPLWNPPLWDTIEKEIDALDASLEELSLSIHSESIHPRNVHLQENLNTPQAHPELRFEERYADSYRDKFRRLLITYKARTRRLDGLRIQARVRSQEKLHYLYWMGG